MKPEYKPFVDSLIELCIREDIGDGDHTSLSCIPADEHGHGCKDQKASGRPRRHDENHYSPENYVRYGFRPDYYS